MECWVKGKIEDVKSWGMIAWMELRWMRLLTNGVVELAREVQQVWEGRLLGAKNTSCTTGRSQGYRPEN